MTINPITGKANQSLHAPSSPGKKDSTETSEKVDNGGQHAQVDIAAIANGIKQAFESTSSASVVDFDKVAKVKDALLLPKKSWN